LMLSDNQLPIRLTLWSTPSPGRMSVVPGPASTCGGRKL